MAKYSLSYLHNVLSTFKYIGVSIYVTFPKGVDLIVYYHVCPVICVYKCELF